jgi:hypothetical protein
MRRSVTAISVTISTETVVIKSVSALEENCRGATEQALVLQKSS